MPANFSRTLRSIQDDGRRVSLTAMLVAGALLIAWAAWFTLAEVALYEVSVRARLETLGTAHPIQPSVTGKVVASYLELEREVRPGDVLLELDAQAERLELEEALERYDTLTRQLALLRSEREANESAQAQEGRVARALVQRSDALAREAAARSRLAGEVSKRLRHLHEKGSTSELDAMRAASEAAERKAAARASAADAKRTEWESKMRQSERTALLERLARDVATGEGEQQQLAKKIERLRFEIERRVIRSPVAGRLGEVVPLVVGSVVNAGTALGAVIPPGELRVVAEFPASTAIGRIVPGDLALLRLDGFPWIEFGSIRAVVSRVGNEPREGRVRAELQIDPESAPRIPKQHGLVGVAEVEVERISPARLVLRTVGAALGRMRTRPTLPPPTPQEQRLAGDMP